MASRSIFHDASGSVPPLTFGWWEQTLEVKDESLYNGEYQEKYFRTLEEVIKTRGEGEEQSRYMAACPQRFNGVSGFPICALGRKYGCCVVTAFGLLPLIWRKP